MAAIKFPPKGKIISSNRMANERYDCSLYIERWRGIGYNHWNFQRLNDALYCGYPGHLCLNLTHHYAHKTGHKDIELCLIPLQSFWGMMDWNEIQNPNNFCMVILPDKFNMTFKFFDRNTRVARAFFMKQGFDITRATLLQYFLNAVIDPTSKFADSLARHGKKWGERTRK